MNLARELVGIRYGEGAELAVHFAVLSLAGESRIRRQGASDKRLGLFRRMRDAQAVSALTATFGVSDRAIRIALSGTTTPEGKLLNGLPRSMDDVRASPGRTPVVNYAVAGLRLPELRPVGDHPGGGVPGKRVAATHRHPVHDRHDRLGVLGELRN